MPKMELVELGGQARAYLVLEPKSEQVGLGATEATQPRGLLPKAGVYRDGRAE
jgi:hypothetical protein